MNNPGWMNHKTMMRMNERHSLRIETALRSGGKTKFMLFHHQHLLTNKNDSFFLFCFYFQYDNN